MLHILNGDADVQSVTDLVSRLASVVLLLTFLLSVD